MAKTKISEFSATPANNTDIDSINIAEGCAPSGINDAIRELMAQLKDFQTGAVGDSVSYTNLQAHETRGKLVCRLLLEQKNTHKITHQLNIN